MIRVHSQSSAQLALHLGQREDVSAMRNRPKHLRFAMDNSVYRTVG